MTLERIELGALALEWEDCGAGEPVLLIHGGALADGFVPLLGQPALQRYRLLRYRREGYGKSTRSQALTSIVEQAAQAQALARRLGIDRAHVVGHSSGGSIALQLAHDAPGFVSSLALLEPVLPGVPTGPAVAGAAGEPVFAARHRLLLRWFPQAESCVLPAVSHLMLLQDPRGLAHCLAEFFARCPAAPLT